MNFFFNAIFVYYEYQSFTRCSKILCMTLGKTPSAYASVATNRLSNLTNLSFLKRVWKILKNDKIRFIQGYVKT